MATLAQEEEDRLRELMESSGMPNRSGTIGPSRGSVRGFSVVDADRRQQARPSGDPLYGNAINPIVANAIKEEQLRIERERIAAAERESQGNLDLKRQAQEADNQVRGQELRLKGGALKNDYDINRRRVDFDYDKLNSDVNADNLNRVQREYLASMDDQMTREGWQEQRGRDLNAWKQDSVRTLESEISQRLKSLDGKELTGVGKEQYNRLLGGLRAIQKGRATNIPQVQSEMLAKWLEDFEAQDLGSHVKPPPSITDTEAQRVIDKGNGYAMVTQPDGTIAYLKNRDPAKQEDDGLVNEAGMPQIDLSTPDAVNSAWIDHVRKNRATAIKEGTAYLKEQRTLDAEKSGKPPAPVTPAEALKAAREMWEEEQQVLGFMPSKQSKSSQADQRDPNESVKDVWRRVMTQRLAEKQGVSPEQVDPMQVEAEMKRGAGMAALAKQPQANPYVEKAKAQIAERTGLSPEEVDPDEAQGVAEEIQVSELGQQEVAKLRDAGDENVIEAEKILSTRHGLEVDLGKAILPSTFNALAKQTKDVFGTFASGIKDAYAKGRENIYLWGDQKREMAKKYMQTITDQDEIENLSPGTRYLDEYGNVWKAMPKEEPSKKVEQLRPQMTMGSMK